MNDAELTRRVKALAGEAGFSMAGVAPAVTPTGFARLGEWLAAGYVGEMHYIAERLEDYAHPERLLDGARSVLMFALDYRTAEPQAPQLGEGRVSRYAWGARDYHDIVRKKLYRIADAIKEWRPGSNTRCIIDTAPLLEREFAVLAGLGWVGKNTLVLNKSRGSYFFLASVLTDTPLDYDTPHETDHCGTCTACLDACPTQAFVAPRLLDASRCISYLTIEHPDLPSPDLREGLGEWLFGCDVCQDVCPWNRHSQPATEQALWPLKESNPLKLAPLFELDDDAFRRRFLKTPLWRPKRRGLLRNAALVLGATRAAGSEAALARGLRDSEPLVRAAAAWALGRLGTEAAVSALNRHSLLEGDDSVRDEISAALDLNKTPRR
ncbi:queG [Symbiodinium sp. CCMP2456]|nr:queG [Symbiodinium sp. CCMP2456]